MPKQSPFGKSDRKSKLEVHNKKLKFSIQGNFIFTNYEVERGLVESDSKIQFTNYDDKDFHIVNLIGQNVVALNL